jgi:hypothetical protein
MAKKVTKPVAPESTLEPVSQVSAPIIEQAVAVVSEVTKVTSSYNDSIYNQHIVEATKPSYYMPNLVDFNLGAIYMQKWAGNSNGAWRETMLDEECYDMSLGHCEFMSIVSNVKRTKGGFYRIKFLDGEDIEMLGFKKVMSGIYVISNCTLVLDWSSKFNVKVSVDDELIYRGRVLNLNELKGILLTLCILKDETRDGKFKQYGANDV